MNTWQSSSKSYLDLRTLTARLDAEFREPPASIAGLRKAGRSAHSLSTSVKELLALAMALASGNEHRIRCHVQSARRSGATRREITDTIAVAVLVGGEELTLAGEQALRVLEQFENTRFYLELAETARARAAVGFRLADQSTGE
jgi:AhpD family alkylhydroperoxidase